MERWFKNGEIISPSEITNLLFPNWFQNTTNCPVPYFWAYRIPTESDAKLAKSGIFFLSVYLDAEKPQ